MSPRKKTRVKSAARADRMKAKWADKTKGTDGLTYAERMAKHAKDQRERELAARKNDNPAPTPTATPPGGKPETQLPSSKADPPAPEQKKTETVRRYSERFYG